ncbi:MAG: TRAP transporter permease [Tissierellales bacterium]|nr:TRAP transporter permease [Tissierellales bacterium]
MQKKLNKWMIIIFSVILGCFQLYTSFNGILEPLIQRSIHLSLILSIAFLIYPVNKNGKIGWDGIVLSIIALIFIGYIAYNYNYIISKMGTSSQIDIFFGIISILLLIEATRRSNGLPLVILTIIFIAYAFLGRYMPDMIAHKGYNLNEMIYYIFLSTEGIFGTALGVSSIYIYLFIMFGAVLQKTGLGEFFNDISLSLLGQFSGGPAKVAVVASGLMGTINGSAVANVATTGAFTIPMMKNVGYSSVFAAAVEATSSVGGYIMPPIMASTAFIMAEMLKIPYLTIVKSAIIPAVLYYLAIILMVHFRAKKTGLHGIKKSELPIFKDVMKTRGFLLIPIVILVTLLVLGYTPLFAAFYGIVSAVIVSFFSKATQLKPNDYIDIFVISAKNTLSVAIACGIVGVVLGTATITGIGLRAASTIVSLGGGNVLLTLFFTMLASIIIGMGLPSIPTYILTVTMAAPALTSIGIPALAAHMFAFYFGSMANLTPPVALAAFTGAGIAGSDPTKTGFAAMKLAAAGFLIPYVFVFSPEMLLIDTTIFEIARITFTGILGVLALSFSIEGFGLVKSELWERILGLVCALLLVTTQLSTDILGVIIFVSIFAYQINKSKNTSNVLGV